MFEGSRQWIVMTGVTRGIGRSIARQLRARGFFVCALARKESLAAAGNEADRVLQWDCALPWEDNDSVNLLDFLSDNPVVGIIHAAGLLGPMDKPPHPSDAPHWKQWREDYLSTVRVNLTAGVELVQAARPFMQKQKSSTTQEKPAFVMHLSSGAAVKAYAGWNSYCASKAAMLMEFKCLAAQCSSDELLCLSVAPGTVMTDMMKQVLSANPDDFPALGKFRELEKSGGLVTPDSAAKKIVDWLIDSSTEQLCRWHGELYDVRTSS
ncbi:MAG: hypothetical protein RL189_2594 [Pseudomonadota bacterium]|jgi:NAD(P)-dependent dehydrogenase (short-subunit alcohol dehydrogenase family)